MMSRIPDVHTLTFSDMHTCKAAAHLATFIHQHCNQVCTDVTADCILHDAVTY